LGFDNYRIRRADLCKLLVAYLLIKGFSTEEDFPTCRSAVRSDS